MSQQHFQDQSSGYARLSRLTLMGRITFFLCNFDEIFNIPGGLSLSLSLTAEQGRRHYSRGVIAAAVTPSFSLLDAELDDANCTQ